MTTARKRQSKDQESPARQSGPLDDLQERLGYVFSRPELLELALTHRSFPYEARTGLTALYGQADSRAMRNDPGTDNEQLEFVGDAVLQLVVTEAMYREFPQCSEGELTRLRASLVSRKRLAEIGTELRLGELLRLGRSAEQNGGRIKPALLANTAEAIVAAIYLDARDSGLDGLKIIRELAERLLVQPALPQMHAALAATEGRGALRDHKTLLQEKVQASDSGKLRYVDTAQSGPPHQRSFAVEAQLETAEGTHVLSSAEGPSKKEAQQRAAELALANWPPKEAA